ncbi:hypothetical protein DY000_02054292 [Brassica cretica]|uniref:Uncharacterized protein n=1 Tax=Brassica cretica TaxID=69181 RepID=A0ABQ7AJF4_BRACR|nr:hypothetical protein DY000_02054292 [Brassica cretica]
MRIIGQELENDRYAATKRMLRSVVTQQPNACSARSLRSDVATEFEPKLSRYVATKRPFRSVAT